MALNYNVTGPVTYTFIGSPTVVDGIASNFSGTSYLQTTAAQTEETSSFEWNVKFNTGTISTDYASYVLGSNAHGGIYVTAGKQVRVTWINSNSAWVEKKTNYTVSDDTTYTVNVKADNATETAVITIFSESGSVLFTETYTDVTCRRMNALFWIGMRAGSEYTNNYWRGSVDLNASYIKINGQPWFGLCPVEVKHIKYGGATLGYTKVGSPTISYNGIASNFSVDDYLTFTTPSNFPTTGMKSYELYTKFTTESDTNTTQGIFCSRSYGGFSLGLGLAYNHITGNLRYVKQSDGTVTAIDCNLSDYTLQANTTYYAKYILNLETGSLTVGISTDNATFTEKTVTASDYAGPQQHAWIMGIGGLYYAPFFGSIDLNNTYIKTDGKLFFWQPNTNYVIKDDKLVFADSGLYIDDNGTKTYATKDIAPVPSGFTYGNTTTSAIGYVDMRTQAFTAAPTGATIGRD